MNEKVVTVKIDRPEGGQITYTEGRAWDTNESNGALYIFDSQGRIIATHRDWASVYLADDPSEVDAA